MNPNKTVLHIMLAIRRRLLILDSKKGIVLFAKNVSLNPSQINRHVGQRSLSKVQRK